MAFNINPGKQQFSATASQTVFTFNFAIFADTDLKVYKTLAGAVANDTTDLLTLSTHYTVSINGTLGGTVTLLLGASLNDTITVVRSLPIARTTDYVTNGDLYAEILDLDQDYQTYLVLDQKQKWERSVVLPDTYSGSQIDFPVPSQYKFIRWNLAEDGFENVDPSTVLSSSDAAIINNVTDFLSIDTSVYTTAIVKDLDRGGTFIWSSTGTANGGTVFAGATGFWTRQYSGAINVKWFGAKGDGIVDDTASVQLAIDSLSAFGGSIFFPVGVFLISSITINKQCLIVGSGMSTGGTVIKPKNAASHVFDITESAVSIQEITFTYGVVQTGGSYIHCSNTSGIVNIENVLMLNWFTGILIESVGDIRLSHVLLKNGVVTTGTAVKITTGGEIRLYDVIVDNAVGTQPFAGVYITSCEDVSMYGCQFIHCLKGLFIQPGLSGDCTSIYAIKCYFDNCSGYGLHVQPSSVGAVAHRITFTNCWFSSSTLNGIALDTITVGGFIDGITFAECEIYLNGSHGVALYGVNTINTRITESKIAQNTGSGILLAANVGKCHIMNNTIGAISSLTGNTAFGVQLLAGTSNDLQVIGNNIIGNTSGTISNGSTGVRRRISENSGHNPVGSSSITVGASPFTFTASDSPTDVFINGGTVSLIKVDGASMLQSTNHMIHLEPLKSVEVTYSVAPAMVRYIN